MHRTPMRFMPLLILATASGLLFACSPTNQSLVKSGEPLNAASQPTAQTTPAVAEQTLSSPGANATPEAAGKSAASKTGAEFDLAAYEKQIQAEVDAQIKKEVGKSGSSVLENTSAPLPEYEEEAAQDTTSDLTESQKTDQKAYEPQPMEEYTSADANSDQNHSSEAQANVRTEEAAAALPMVNANTVQNTPSVEKSGAAAKPASRIWIALLLILLGILAAVAIFFWNRNRNPQQQSLRAVPAEQTVSRYQAYLNQENSANTERVDNDTAASSSEANASEIEEQKAAAEIAGEPTRSQKALESTLQPKAEAESKPKRVIKKASLAKTPSGKSGATKKMVKKTVSKEKPAKGKMVTISKAKAAKKVASSKRTVRQGMIYYF